MKQRPLRGIGTVAPSQLVELASSVRDVVDHMLRIEDAPEVLGEARRQVDEVARRLAPHARPNGAPRLGRDGEPADARPYYVDGVMLPRHHPQAPELEIETQGGVTRGRVTFGVSYEGPPGHVHGGHVACFFDQILGHHNLEHGIPAMTASLTVHYRRPTPLFTRLSFEVRMQSREGRKVVTAGTLSSPDALCAEGEGFFLLPGRGLETP